MNHTLIFLRKQIGFLMISMFSFFAFSLNAQSIKDFSNMDDLPHGVEFDESMFVINPPETQPSIKITKKYREAMAAQLPEIFYYKFDEAGNNTTVNYANPGRGISPAVINVLTMGGAGQFGSALIGTGGNSATDYVNTGWATDIGNSDWTVSIWISMPATGVLHYLYADENAGNFRTFTGGVSGTGNILLRGPLNDVLVTGVAPGPSVVHFVYDSSVPEIRAYKNGVLVNTVAQALLNINGGGPFKIGGKGTSTGMPLNTHMDEFRFYDRALDAAEIAATWNIELGGSVNEPPNLQGAESNALDYSEGDDPVAVTGTIRVIDNNNLIESATIAISANYNYTQDRLNFTNTASITGSFNETSGVLTLSGDDTPDAYMAALRSITYENTSENPLSILGDVKSSNSSKVFDTQPRMVTFTVFDGEFSSNMVYRFINLISINDAPVLSNIEETPLEYTLGGAPVNLTDLIEISDLDNTKLEEATVQITGNYVQGEDFLLAESTSEITSAFNVANGLLKLTGLARLSKYEDILRVVKFVSTAGDDSPVPDKTITIKVNDGNDLSNAAERVISISQSAGSTGPANATNVQVSFNTDGTIIVTWTDNSDNEQGFIIYREVVGSANKTRLTAAYEPVSVVDPNVESFIDTDVTEGLFYNYKVVAYNSEGTSGSEESSGQLTMALLPPDGLTCVVDENNYVTLEWVDNSGIEDGYKIERNDGTGFVEFAEVTEGITTFVDSSLTGGDFTYRVKAFNANSESEYSNEASCTIVGVEEWADGIPVEYTLLQNYPNPFNPSTTIGYSLPSEGYVRISVYNMLGQQVAILVDEFQSPGHHEISFNAAGLNSGIYLYKIEAGSFNQIKKMILMK